MSKEEVKPRLQGIVTLFLNVGTITPENLKVYLDGMRNEIFPPELTQRLQKRV